MSYDRNRAAPSSEAHNAAAALDSIIESLLDGFQLSDAIVAFAAAPQFAAYAFEDGLSKGESISRITQVLSLLERDNGLFDGLVPEPWGADADDDEPTE